MGGPWDIQNTDSELGKSKWLAKGNQKKMHNKSDSNYHEGETLSAHHVSIYTHSFPRPPPPRSQSTLFILNF